MKKLLLLIGVLIQVLIPKHISAQNNTVYDLHQYIAKDPVIMLEIAQAHQALNNYDSAFYYLDKAEKVLDDKLAVRQLRGILAREAKRYDKAIAIFYSLVEVDSDARYMYMEEVARTYYQKKSFNNAIQTYRILVQDNPVDKKRYLYEIGMCYYETQRKENAIRYFRQAAHAGHEHAATLVTKFEAEK